MFALYRLLKPLAFSCCLVTRVLILGRMLSLISTAKSPRARRLVARLEMCGLLFAAASSVISCALMWVSSAQSFKAADAYALASRVAGNSTSDDPAFAVAKTNNESSSLWNTHNNLFLLIFYAVYATACVVMAAFVFHTMRSMLQSIEAQKLLLEETSTQDDDQSVEHASRLQVRAQLISINDVADQKSQRLRSVLIKIALNCSVVVVAALFSLWIDSFSVIGGFQPVNPPPPCPSGAKKCDACKSIAVTDRNTSNVTRHTSNITLHTCLPCNTATWLFVKWVNGSSFWLGTHW